MFNLRQVRGDYSSHIVHRGWGSSSMRTPKVRGSVGEEGVVQAYFLGLWVSVPARRRASQTPRDSHPT